MKIKDIITIATIIPSTKKQLATKLKGANNDARTEIKKVSIIAIIKKIAIKTESAAKILRRVFDDQVLRPRILAHQ